MPRREGNNRAHLLSKRDEQRIVGVRGRWHSRSRAGRGARGRGSRFLLNDIASPAPARRAASNSPFNPAVSRSSRARPRSTRVRSASDRASFLPDRTFSSCSCSIRSADSRLACSRHRRCCARILAPVQVRLGNQVQAVYRPVNINHSPPSNVSSAKGAAVRSCLESLADEASRHLRVPSRSWRSESGPVVGVGAHER